MRARLLKAERDLPTAVQSPLAFAKVSRRPDLPSLRGQDLLSRVSPLKRLKGFGPHTMMASVSNERRASATATTTTSGLLSLAGDALRLAVTALRLSPPPPPEVALSEVAWHDRCDDCWVVVQDRVFDVTPLLALHPGGAEVLLEHAGLDATRAFQGFGHSDAAAAALERYCVGVLPPHERLYDDQGRLRPPR